MLWIVLGLLVTLWVLGIASQSQDFTVDDSAPLDWARESTLQQAVYMSDRTGKPASQGLREPLEC